MEPKKHFFGVYSIHIKFGGIYWGIGRFLTCGGDGKSPMSTALRVGLLATLRFGPGGHRFLGASLMFLVTLQLMLSVNEG